MTYSEMIAAPSDGDTDAAAVAGDLPGIIWQVWTAYLNAEPVTTAMAGKFPGSADVTANVCIAGVWPGHVVLRGTLDAATAITAAMMGLREVNVDRGDIRDAVGELMNIVAGNVKSLLPQPSFVSLPQVVLGNAGVSWPGAVPIHRVAVRWDTHMVAVEVLRGEKTAG